MAEFLLGTPGTRGAEPQVSLRAGQSSEISAGRSKPRAVLQSTKPLSHRGCRLGMSEDVRAEQGWGSKAQLC